MIPIVCIEDKNGMMFNHRRLSMDRALRDDLLQQIAPQKLWMNAYSYEQFKDTSYEHIIVNDQFLQSAKPGEYCFVEDQLLKDFIPKIEGMILYRWNRRYPADLYFDLDLNQLHVRCTETTRFPGNSHALITKEVYTIEK